MISERSEETKTELLKELASATQLILFTRWWRRARHFNGDRAQLAAVVARLIS